MYLSKLEELGFKSFAQKTTIKLNDGMSCIIGPNGSGKSNIVDAIRWVLGEQKVSSLRTDRMENIIFNGTNTRKPLGMAEVSLTIHNNKNVLKNTFSEVVISRRLYRSGESHYLINKSPCRLKDIIDLFMDTGMGANSYSVIELNMVESIISENAAERRHLFEEAAGINKYKSRRKSAMRKLESTRQDMSRISDLISEIQRTVNSLSRQVGKARRYLRFKDELKSIEIDMARYRFTRMMDEIQPLQKQLDEISLIKEDTSHQITLEEALLEEYKREIIQFEERLQEYGKQINEQDDKIYQIKEEDAVAQARAQALKETIRRNDTDVEEFKGKIRFLENRVTEFSEKESNLNIVVTDLENIHDEKDREYKSINSRVTENKSILQDYNDRYREMSDIVLTLREQIQEKNIHLKTNHDLVLQLKDDISNAQKQEIQLKKATDELAENKKILEHKHKQIVDELERLNQINETTAGKIEDLKDKLQKKISLRETNESRIQFFEQLISKYEGHSRGTQYLMMHKSDFPGLIGPISDVLEVADEHKIAVETALGDSINYIIIEKLDFARKAIERLQKEKAGRVTLLPLDMLSTIAIKKDQTIWQDERLLAKRVKCDEQYRKIFDILLGDVFLVSSLEEALKNSAQSNGIRFVTPRGELMHHAHALSGGEIANQESSVIGRKDRMKQLVKEEKNLETDIQKLAREIDQEIKIKSGLQSDIEHTVEEKSNIAFQILDLDKMLAQKEFEQLSVRNQINTKKEQLTGAEHHIASLRDQMAVIQTESQGQNKKFQELEKEMQNLAGKYEGENQALQELAARVHEHQVQLIEEQNNLKNVYDEKARMIQQISDLNSQILRRQEETKKIHQQLAKLETDTKERAQRQKDIWDERDKIDSEKDKIQDSYHEIRDKILNLENQIKKYRKQHDTTLERSRQLELQIQENQMKAANIKERIQEEYREDISTGIASDHLNVEESEQKIESLKYKITQLGQVNPLAVSEYEKESERLEFYTKQYNDLEEAEKSLNKTINKINVTARTQFLETFNQIKMNFERVFQSFFQNGEGTLKIEEDSDPLESGIEILVRPKGKRVQTINLLSGGEKTLTAISLLFAIYLVKPSPFCILDEIDAPLDDVNIGRFTKALREFSTETQFIVVTHNKRTMEAADTMYGVTMEEEGLSKLVSVKFN